MIQSKPQPSEQPRGLDFLKVIWRQRLPAFLFLLGVMVYVTISNFLAKPVYQAQAKVVYEAARETEQLFYPYLGSPLAADFTKSYLADEIEATKTLDFGEEIARALPPN